MPPSRLSSPFPSARAHRLELLSFHGPDSELQLDILTIKFWFTNEILRRGAWTILIFFYAQGVDRVFPAKGPVINVVRNGNPQHFPRLCTEPAPFYTSHPQVRAQKPGARLACRQQRISHGALTPSYDMDESHDGRRGSPVQPVAGTTHSGDAEQSDALWLSRYSAPGCHLGRAENARLGPPLLRLDHTRLEQFEPIEEARDRRRLCGGQHYNYPRSVGEFQAWFRTYSRWGVAARRWPDRVCQLSPPHLGDGGDDLRPDAYAAHGVVHRVLAVRHAEERYLGAEPAAGPRDRLVPDGVGDAASAALGARAARTGPARWAWSRSTRPIIGGEEPGLRGGRARGKKSLVGIAVEVKEAKGIGRCRMAHPRRRLRGLAASLCHRPRRARRDGDHRRLAGIRRHREARLHAGPTKPARCPASGEDPTRCCPACTGSPRSPSGGCSARTRDRSRRRTCRAISTSSSSASTAATRGVAASCSNGCSSSPSATIRFATATSSPAGGLGTSRRPRQRSAGIHRAWSGRQPSGRGGPLTWATPVKWRPLMSVIPSSGLRSGPRHRRYGLRQRRHHQGRAGRRDHHLRGLLAAGHRQLSRPAGLRLPADHLQDPRPDVRARHQMAHAPPARQDRAHPPRRTARQRVDERRHRPVRPLPAAPPARGHDQAHTPPAPFTSTTQASPAR